MTQASRLRDELAAADMARSALASALQTARTDHANQLRVADQLSIENDKMRVCHGYLLCMYIFVHGAVVSRRLHWNTAGPTPYAWLILRLRFS